MNWVTGTLMNACPNCNEGKVFYNVMRMYEKCSECNLKYEKEPGFFVGAMALSYILGFLSIVPLIMYLVSKPFSMVDFILYPSIQIILTSPLMYRFSRLIWIHLCARTEKFHR